jgi:hypothetical protein
MNLATTPSTEPSTKASPNEKLASVIEHIRSGVAVSRAELVTTGERLDRLEDSLQKVINALTNPKRA